MLHIFGTEGKKLADLINAHKTGYRYFDCSDSYSSVKDVIDFARGHSTVPGDQKIYLIYKINRFPADKAAFETFLRDLQKNHFGCISHIMLHNTADHLAKIDEIWETMEEVGRDLHIKIGLGNLRDDFYMDLAVIPISPYCTETRVNLINNAKAFFKGRDRVNPGANFIFGLWSAFSSIMASDADLRGQFSTGEIAYTVFLESVLHLCEKLSPYVQIGLITSSTDPLKMAANLKAATLAFTSFETKKNLGLCEKTFIPKLSDIIDYSKFSYTTPDKEFAGQVSMLPFLRKLFDLCSRDALDAAKYAELVKEKDTQTATINDKLKAFTFIGAKTFDPTWMGASLFDIINTLMTKAKADGKNCGVADLIDALVWIATEAPTK